MTNTVVRDCCNDLWWSRSAFGDYLFWRGYRALDRESPNRGFDLTLDHQPMRIFKNRLDYFVFYLYRGLIYGLVYTTLATSLALVSSWAIKYQRISSCVAGASSRQPSGQHAVDLKSPETGPRNMDSANATYHRALQLTRKISIAILVPLATCMRFQGERRYPLKTLLFWPPGSDWSLDLSSRELCQMWPSV